MNAADIIKYGHLTLMQAVDGLSEADMMTGGVCGWWSTRDIIAHIASYERMLVEVLNSFLDGGPTPTLMAMGSSPATFNDDEVNRRADMSVAEVLAEYNATHAEAMGCIAGIAPETLREVGTIPWYGADYAVDDLIVYTQYGHKREHSAQIAVFRDGLGAA